MDISDPTIAYILISVGVIGLIVELSVPGTYLPGLLGSVAIVVGLASIAPVWVAVLGAVSLAAFLWFAARKSLEARRLKVMTGWEEIVGSIGEVREPLAPEGQVFVEGALWRAHLDTPGADVPNGTKVRVTDLEGLRLAVEVVEPEQAA